MVMEGIGCFSYRNTGSLSLFKLLFCCLFFMSWHDDEHLFDESRAWFPTYSRLRSLEDKLINARENLEELLRII